MRLTTDFWVSALIRNVFGQGGFAAIMNRGATEAGAVFILARKRSGDVSLYGPAPQTSYDAAKPDDRHFSLVAENADMEAIEARLAKEKRFDPDIWIVEIEAGQIAVEAMISVDKT